MSLPGAYVLDLLAVVAERGVPAATLVADLPVDVSALEDPRARVPISLCEGILSRAIELTGDCGLAQRLGERMPISSHGYLGFAAMTATTIKEAVELAVRFASTRVPAIGLALYTDGPTTSLVLEERRNLPPLLRRFIVIALFSELATIFTSLTGKGLDSDVYVAFPDPGGIISPPGVRVHFDAPAHRVVFATGMLALPIVSADRVACRLAREQCERDLSRLVDNSGIAARVRELLAREDELASLEDIADSLRVSPRTLKRKLADVGVTFSEIRDEHRRQQALLLLDNRDLSVGDVAVRMGYTELTNFTRAFRKWTGLTPQAYRRRGLSG